MLEWNMRAAEGGLSHAMIKVGRAYLKRLPSSLPYDTSAAAATFRRCIALWDEPDCHYGLAQMLLENQTDPQEDAGAGSPQRGTDRLAASVRAFEAAAWHGRSTPADHP